MTTRTDARRAQRFHALDANLRPALTRRLKTFFAGQSERAVHRFLRHISPEHWDRHTKADDLTELPIAAPPAEEVLPDEERQLLWLALLPFLYQTVLNSGNLAGQLVGLDLFLESDPRIAEILRESTLRIAGVHQVTRDAIRTTLAKGVSHGYTIRQIAYGVPEDDFLGLHDLVAEVYKGRSETIARNEIANARAQATAERFQEARIAEVYIMDGSGCGWASHDSSDKANGTRRTLLEYRQTPFSHVNCVRVGLPVIE